MSNEAIDKMVEAAHLLEYATIDNFYTEDFPKKDDILFANSGEIWELNACVGHYRNEMPYSDGYLHGARLLSQSVCLAQQSVDTLVYPIVFLYRHHLELALKNLIIDGSNLTGIAINNPKAFKMHNLNLLWQCFKPIFSELYSNHDNLQELIAGIESYIEQFSKVDKDSFSFRYSQTKDRKRKNLEGVSYINIHEFVINIEKLVTVLEGCNYQIDYLSNSM